MNKFLFKKIEIWILFLFIILGISFSLVFGFVSNKINDPLFKDIREPLQKFYDFPGDFYSEFVQKKETPFASVPDLGIYEINDIYEDNSKIGFNYEKYYSVEDKNYYGIFKKTLNENKILFSLEIPDGLSVIYINSEEKFFYSLTNPEHDYLKTLSKYSFKNKNIKKEWDRDIFFHHQFYIDENSTFFFPTLFLNNNSVYKDFLGSSSVQTYSGLSFRDEGFGSVSKEGDLSRYSLTEILVRNNLSHLILTGPLEPDPYHINSVHIARESFPSKEIQKGDVLLSLRHKSMIIQYRPSQDKVVWHKAGPWLNQHDARFKKDGTISLFNNNVISVINQRTAENYYFNGNYKNNVINYDKEKDLVFEQYSQCIQEISNELYTITGGSVYFDNSKVIIEYTDKGLTLVCLLETKEFEIFGKITPRGLKRGGGLTQQWLQSFNIPN